MGIKLKNPIIFADVPDVDLLRVGDSFYMVSTTMHVLPGGPIMKSTDLVNWKIVSYIFDQIEDNDMYRLENRETNGVYGRGQWATSLRYHKGSYYACFVCNEMKTTYIYYTDDIESSNWKRHSLEGIYHDPSLIWTCQKAGQEAGQEDRLFIVYNCGDITITELEPDASAVKEGGVHRLLFKSPEENMGLRCEGCHAYHIGDYYYLIFIEWPKDGNGRRRQVCYRSKELLGQYERRIILDDDMGYHNKGIAQGAFFDDSRGNWYAMLFQDHDAVGRIPYIMPLTWEKGWPVLGSKDPASGESHVPEEFELPLEAGVGEELVTSDSFNHLENKLHFNWQWNHKPDNSLWSFTQRPGYLRLTVGHLREDVLFARNTLTQRTLGPKCQFTVQAELEGMKPGDHCGLIALQSNYGTVGVKCQEDGKYLVMTTKEGEKYSRRLENQEKCFFRICFDFEDSIDMAGFFWSLDGENFSPVGVDLKMLYTLDHFMGYRIGIFNYGSQETGGFVDFKDFTVSQ